MARYLLLAACCVMVIACFLYTADGASRTKLSCSQRCSRKCTMKYPYGRGDFFGVGRTSRGRGNNGSGNGVSRDRKRMDCKLGCYAKFANCRLCPYAESCTLCAKGYELIDGRCVVQMPSTPATTPAPPPAETTPATAEATTTGAPACPKTGLQCDSGLVIDRLKVCDRKNDCGDNSDEAATLCGDSLSTYNCNGIDRSNREICDCESECSVGADEQFFACSKCPLGLYDCGGDNCELTAADCFTNV